MTPPLPPLPPQLVVATAAHRMGTPLASPSWWRVQFEDRRFTDLLCKSRAQVVTGVRDYLAKALALPASTPRHAFYVVAAFGRGEGFAYVTGRNYTFTLTEVAEPLGAASDVEGVQR